VATYVGRLLIDEYRKTWALRYLREAKADLAAAETSPIASTSVHLSLLAMRKMQTAISYSLGDPSYLSFLVADALSEEANGSDVPMDFLSQVEWLIQIRSAKASVSDKEDALTEAKQLMKMTLQIVNAII
jgi:hypothetical protein